MSQWAYSPLNLESPEAAPTWPVAMAAQPAKRKKLKEGAPVLWGIFLSEVWLREMGGRPNRSTWMTWADQIGGIHSSLLAKSSMSHGFECPQACVPPGVDLPLQNRWPWISLWYTRYLDFRVLPDHLTLGCSTSELGLHGGPGTCWSDRNSSLPCRVH
jgi:hypothetical protein